MAIILLRGIIHYKEIRRHRNRRKTSVEDGLDSQLQPPYILAVTEFIKRVEHQCESQRQFSTRIRQSPRRKTTVRQSLNPPTNVPRFLGFRCQSND